MRISILLLFLLVCSCAGKPAAYAPALESTISEFYDPASLHILVWNVLHGANDVENGPEEALRVIKETKPQVVLLQESYDIDGERPKLGAWLASELGWNQYQGESTHLCVLTPYEFETTFFHHEWHGVGAKIKDLQGREFLAWSIWIDWRSYITYELRSNPTISDEALLKCETEHSGRFNQASAIIEHLKHEGQLETDIPLLVGGDWNCPSHLDWTVDTARVFKRRRAIQLPVSLAMETAGFTDTYRDIYPNPVQHPGITWSPMVREKVENGEVIEQCFDRIDRLYLKNPEQPTDGWTLTPVLADVYPRIWEDNDIPTRNRRFPSDHCAVLIELQWRR